MAFLLAFEDKPIKEDMGWYELVGVGEADTSMATIPTYTEALPDDPRLRQKLALIYHCTVQVFRFDMKPGLAFLPELTSRYPACCHRDIMTAA